MTYNYDTTVQAGDQELWNAFRRDVLKQLINANGRQKAMIRHYCNYEGGYNQFGFDYEDIAQGLADDMLTCPDVAEYKEMRHWIKWPDTTLYYKAVYASIKYFLKKKYNQSVYAKQAVDSQYMTKHAEDYQETMMNITSTKSMKTALTNLLIDCTEEESTIVMWRIGFISEDEACQALACSRRTLFNKFNAFKASRMGSN